MGKSSDPADYGVEAGTVLLGKYRVDAILGHGGMGVVAQCTHLQLEERVAIKFLRDDVTLDDETRRRFIREAQNAVKLKSEHVARVTDVGTFPESGVPYMVMEYLEGIDLAQMLEESGKLNPSLAVALLLQASIALAEAHSLGIVHRDIKPGNLFVTWRADGSPLVKILDFGISKAPIGADLNLTQTQSLLGTPAYMSPEQMRSARTADPRSDIWSLGTVLYELLQGQRPFQAESFSETCVKVAVDPPAPLTVPCPPGLERVIKRALEKDPEARYQSIAEMARDLAPFARDKNAAIVMVERMSRMLGRSRAPFDRDASSPNLLARATPVPMPVPVPPPAPEPEPEDPPIAISRTKTLKDPVRPDRDSDRHAIDELTEDDVDVDSLPGEATAITRYRPDSGVLLTDSGDGTARPPIHVADSAERAAVDHALDQPTDPTKSPWTPEKITAQAPASKRVGPTRAPVGANPSAPSAAINATASPAMGATLPGLFSTRVKPQATGGAAATLSARVPSVSPVQAGPTALVAATVRPTAVVGDRARRARRPVVVVLGAAVILALAVGLGLALTGGDGPSRGKAVADPEPTDPVPTDPLVAPPIETVDARPAATSVPVPALAAPVDARLPVEPPPVDKAHDPRDPRKGHDRDRKDRGKRDRPAKADRPPRPPAPPPDPFKTRDPKRPR